MGHQSRSLARVDLRSGAIHTINQNIPPWRGRFTFPGGETFLFGQWRTVTKTTTLSSFVCALNFNSINTPRNSLIQVSFLFLLFPACVFLFYNQLFLLRRANRWWSSSAHEMLDGHVSSTTINKPNQRNKQTNNSPILAELETPQTLRNPARRRRWSGTWRMCCSCYHPTPDSIFMNRIKVADDPETLRIKQNTKNISNVAYHGDLQKKAAMERQRECTEIIDSKGEWVCNFCRDGRERRGANGEVRGVEVYHGFRFWLVQWDNTRQRCIIPK